MTNIDEMLFDVISRFGHECDLTIEFATICEQYPLWYIEKRYNDLMDTPVFDPYEWEEDL